MINTYLAKRLALLFAILTLGAANQALANEVTSIPVFFATDREMNIENASMMDFLDKQLPEEDVNYGIKLSVPRNRDVSEIDPSAVNGLNWVIDTGSTANVRDITLKEDEFFRRIHEVVDALPESKPIVVFAHGCCTGFQGSCGNAANLARHYCCPVVMYAWCAIPPTITKYRDNEDSESVSETRFDHFMKRMEKEFGAGKIVLVAHSMGNRLLYSYLKQRYNRYGSNPHHAQFKSAAFACADVKASEFQSNEKRVGFNSQVTWVTANDADKALFASWMQSAFYTRLGAPKEFKHKLTHTPTVMVADINSLVGNSHDLPADVLAVLNRANTWTKEPIKIGMNKAKKENLITITAKK